MPVDEHMASTSFFDLASNSNAAGRMASNTNRPIDTAREFNGEILDTNHPLRQFLLQDHENEVTRQQSQNLPDTLEEIILRQLRSRTVSLVVGNGIRNSEINSSLFGNQARTMTIETAMDHLRRQMRSSLTETSDELVHRRPAEPRDQLEQARGRIYRPGHVQRSLLSESFARWNLNRRQRLDGTDFIPARDIYAQTVARLQRTREILAVRQNHHMMLSTRAGERNRANARGIQIDSLDAPQSSSNISDADFENPLE